VGMPHVPAGSRSRFFNFALSVAMLWCSKGAAYAIGKGNVLLLSAVLGACTVRPGKAVTLLEIARVRCPHGGGSKSAAALRPS
jgi:hypothetical protein